LIGNHDKKVFQCLCGRQRSKKHLGIGSRVWT
jgi:hypothetical protein